MHGRKVCGFCGCGDRRRQAGLKEARGKIALKLQRQSASRSMTTSPQWYADAVSCFRLNLLHLLPLFRVRCVRFERADTRVILKHPPHVLQLARSQQLLVGTPHILLLSKQLLVGAPHTNSGGMKKSREGWYPHPSVQMVV